MTASYRDGAGRKAVVVLSGGQDSVTCLFWALREFDEVQAISFDYGQRHRVELEGAADICRREGVAHRLINVNGFGQLAPSALTDDSIAVKEKGGMNDLPSTFVPGRNAFFLTLAAAYAVPLGISEIVIGTCETDFSGYPDCREEFVSSMERSLSLAMGQGLRIHRPLMFLSKAETFALANALGQLDTIVRDTHTCYEGVRDRLHAWGYGCGTCPACKLRKKGYDEYVASLNSAPTSHI